MPIKPSPLPDTATTSGPPALASAPTAATAPRGHPSWSGLLRFSLLALPVKAYSTVSSAATPQFHQLHAGCGQRIRHEKRCPLHGPVDASAIVRGYPYGPDQHVVVEPEVLERFRPAKDKALLLEQFVSLSDIDPIFYAVRSLNLVPDGPAAQHLYGVLVAALTRAGKAALGRVVLSSHRQLVLVRARGQLLVMDVLH